MRAFKNGEKAINAKIIREYDNYIDLTEKSKIKTGVNGIWG